MASSSDEAQAEAGEKPAQAEAGDEQTGSDDADEIWMETESIRGAGESREEFIQRIRGPGGGESRGPGGGESRR